MKELRSLWDGRCGDRSWSKILTASQAWFYNLQLHNTGKDAIESIEQLQADLDKLRTESRDSRESNDYLELRTCT